MGENDIRNFLTEALFDTGNLAGEITDYDIIYVNWDKGKDHLQRNALLLEDIILWVNSVKNGNAPNVVLGQSMGGVLARYALADMEQRNLLHDTDLYISHDAPHQGANIPLGILYFARHMVDQFVSTPLGDMNINPEDGAPVSIEDIKDLIDAPGTQQLLANNVASNFAVNNSLHDAWQADLEGKGYPQLTRNIAISNGSHCANPQDFNPSDTLFALNGNGKTSLLTDFLLEVLGPITGLGYISLAVLFDEPALLVGILPGNTKFNMDFNVKALPNVGNNNQIYKGKITFTKKLLWFINITVNITDRSYNNPTGILSYDYYPGGQYNVPFDFENSSASNALGNYGITSYLVPAFDFIPVPSALDVGRGIANLNNSDYFKTYTSANPPIGSKAIPFVNFTTSHQPNNSLNEQHISFNTRNGDWLATELNSIVNDEEIFDCSAFCSNSEIIGSDFLCTTGVYSVTNQATTVNWSVSDPNNLVSFTTNGNEITLTQNNNLNGTITLTVNFENDACGSTSVTKDIWVGKPTVTTSGLNGGYDNVSINTSSQFGVAWAEGNTHYYWSVTPNTTCSAGSGPTINYTNQNTYNSTSRYANINWGVCPGTYSVVCYAKNNCGMTYIGQKWVTVYDPNNNDPCPPIGLKVFPNPVKNGSITVQKPAPGDPCNDDPLDPNKQMNIINDVKIYDMYGVLVYTNSFNTNKFNINGLKLKRGHYILNVQSSDGQILRKLIIAE